ncbi:Kif9, partial [Symbiodinium pilosum]
KPSSGLVDGSSWHGGAAVRGAGRGKWTLQKFREAPQHRECCAEAFARGHGCLRLPSTSAGVRFVEGEPVTPPIGPKGSGRG